MEKIKQDTSGFQKSLIISEEIRARLSDMLEEHGALEMAFSMANLIVNLLAVEYPAQLTTIDKKKIKDNCSDATDFLISTRAMNPVGIEMMLEIATTLSTIAIDYCPASHSKQIVEHDQKNCIAVEKVLEPIVTAAYDAAQATGLSPFGTSTVLMLLGAKLGLEKGLNNYLVIKSLLGVIVDVLDASEVDLSSSGVIL